MCVQIVARTFHLVLCTEQVFVKYTGRLAHNQKIFDSNITQKKAFMFRLGQGEVVKGWDEGLNGTVIVVKCYVALYIWMLENGTRD